MFASMMKLVTEQQERDGAIRHAEFDTVAFPGGGYTFELRKSVKDMIKRSIPERHSFMASDGRDGITYFDRRGRAVSGILDELEDDELAWIAMSMNPKMNASGSIGYAHPVQEEAGFTLTPKSRTIVEKFVYAKFPPDAKKKAGGRMVVMFSGESAKVAGVTNHMEMALDRVPCGRLVDVARLVGYTGDIEKLKEAVEEEADRLPDGMGKFVASLKTAVERDFDLRGWRASAAGNVRAQVQMDIGGMSITVVIDGAKRYPNNSSPVQVKNTWVAGNPKIWGGGSIAKTMDAIRQATTGKVEDRLDERSSGPVRTSRDAMDPSIAVYSVASKDMDEDAFGKWLRAKGVHAKIQKTGDGFRAVAEEVVP